MSPEQKDMNCHLDTSSRSIPFWSKDPNILFQQPFLFELFPVENMSYNQKLNAITRSVILLTLVGFLFDRSFRLVAVSFITILAIFLMHFAHTKSDESFIANGGNPIISMDEISDMNLTNPTLYQQPAPINPLGNVLLPDYDYNPHKKPAPPIQSAVIKNDILSQAKRMVAEANPGQPDITDKLFNDLASEITFEQSMRQYYTTANTTIPNDQGAFADFCYGSMVSCKEGNEFACSRNNPRYTTP